MTIPRILPWLGACALLALAACSSDDGGGTGRISLDVTDAPVDGATSVVVVFTGVELKPSDGAARTITFDTPRSIDLLALADGATAVILDGEEVGAGRYNWIRLAVQAEEDGQMDSYIVLEDGTQRELRIPSGAETGLKLHGGVIVPQGGETAYTVDFDLRKSVHEPMNAGEAYQLRPTLRLVDNAEVGTISGTVDAARVGEGCTPGIYVFEGSGATPDDIDGTAPDPLATAEPQLNGETGDYDYTVAFLSAGSYTMAYTCGMAADDPATDDATVFDATADATVSADQVTDVDFAAPP